MKDKIKIVSIFVIINLLFSITYSSFKFDVVATNQIETTDIYSIDSTKYPGIKEKIQSLQSQHPNWNFKILYTGINWNEAVTYEYTGHKKSPKNLVAASSNYSGDWVCKFCGDTSYDSGNWRCASEAAIKYMMDPRASLNSSDIFQFMELSYNYSSGYSRDVVKTMLSGTFLDNDSYINTIMDSCKTNNVNPYYIVARILQEQGKSGSTLSSGKGYNGQYVGYYNVFNIGASGSNKEKVILNGLAKAKNYGWNTMEKALSGGIKVIAQNYIAVGQDTMYFQKFDVENSDGNLYWHQYMQNILAAQNEGATLRKTLASIDAIDYKYTFVIPVYENMPVNTASRPSTQNTSSKIEVDLIKTNVTSNIKMRNAPNGSSSVGSLSSGEIATRIERASSKVNGTYWDKVLKYDGTVGYVARCTYDNESTYKEYLISVGGTGMNTNNGGSSSQGNNNTSTVGKGDVNGDGKIDAMDMYLIIQHILETQILTGENLNQADINSDNKIDAMDMYLIIQNIINS